MTAGVFISMRCVRVDRASVEEYSVLDVQWRTISHTGRANHHTHRFVAWYCRCRLFGTVRKVHVKPWCERGLASGIPGGGGGSGGRRPVMVPAPKGVVIRSVPCLSAFNDSLQYVVTRSMNPFCERFHCVRSCSPHSSFPKCPQKPRHPLVQCHTTLSRHQRRRPRRVRRVSPPTHTSKAWGSTQRASPFQTVRDSLAKRMHERCVHSVHITHVRNQQVVKD